MDVILRLLQSLTFFNITVLIAELVFCFKLPKRKKFVWRLLVIIPYAIFLNSGISGLIGLPSIPAYLGFSTINLAYIVIFALSVLIIWFLFDTNIVEILYLCTAGYAVQYTSTYLLQSIMCLFEGRVSDTAYTWLLVFVMFAVLAGLLFAAYFVLVKNYFRSRIVRSGKLMIFFSLAAIIILSLISSVFLSLGWHNPATHVYNVIIGTTILFIEFGMFRRQELVLENREMERIFRNQETQSKMYAENVNALNMKYHDLKHQLQLLKLENGENEIIQELEKTLGVYGAKAKTGNGALDTLIFEKNLYCNDHNICLTYNVDGTLLGFMATADLYALFGNAIDNAIEAVREYEPDERQIAVSVSGKGGIVRIIVENYFKGELTFKNDLPVTTKGNEDYHGFGMRSMKYIAQKYGGEMRIIIEDGWFKLKFLFFNKN